MKRAACAKVNLFLRVVGRRSDGYHEIETVFQSVSLCDHVTLERVSGPWDPARIQLTCDAPSIPTGPANLAWRADAALAEQAGAMPRTGLRIHLAKQIPAGGGLGGGSSDAAAVLTGLRRLWGLRMEDAALAEVAARVGSDVPFFLMGGTALGRGRGEILEPMPALPRLHLVLVTPSFGVETAWAYASRIEAGADAPLLSAFREAAATGEPAALAAALRNDLEPGVVARYPEIAAIREEMLAAGALGARMTGSGSTVFGIARDPADAARLAAALARPGRRVFVARTITSIVARGEESST